MGFFETPGAYIVEQPGQRTVQPVGTKTAAFLGQAPDPNARLNELVPVNNWSDFRTKFAPSDKLPGLSTNYLFHAVNGFFQNGGSRCYIVNTGLGGSIVSGLKLLEANDEVSIVAAPGCTDIPCHEALTLHCEKMQDRMCILDAPNVDNTELLKTVETAPIASKTAKPKDKDAATGSGVADKPATGEKPPDGGLRPRNSEFAAFYFPWLVVPDPLNPKETVEIPPSGSMAGIWSRVDVYKAPANEVPRGASGLTYLVTPEEQGPLNSLGVNCIRYFSGSGTLVWGARTLSDPSGDCRYIPVRRTLTFIGQSILRATRWAVFEPNDRLLWKLLKCEVTGFLNNVYRDGALMGRTAEEAFFVKCDEETNPPESIDLGQVNLVIGVAIVKPAEFVIIKIGQTHAGAQVEAM
jgi:Bacteriophage tail sheath protein